MMNRTELVIAKAFWQLLEEKPYSKITVKNIVERCEINRNTFYYHFHDIPDLLDRILKRNANDISPIFQKSLNNGITYNEETKKYEIEITSEDTEKMQMGENAGIYGYDITIYYGGNKPKQKVIGHFKIGTKYTLNEVV